MKKNKESWQLNTMFASELDPFTKSYIIGTVAETWLRLKE